MGKLKLYKIGLENEFSTNFSFSNQLEIENEYYDKQYEDNKNIISYKGKKYLPTMLLKLHDQSLVRIILTSLANTIPYISSEYKILLKFSPNLVNYNWNCFVFNGIHLTIDRNTAPHIYELNENDIEYLIGKIPINSWRKLLSHHLYGKFRYSDYRFKRKDKFTPINLKEDFIELRFVESIDFTNPLKFNELIKFIDIITTKSKTKQALRTQRNKKKFEKYCSLSSEYIRNLEDIKKLVEILKDIDTAYLDVLDILEYGTEKQKIFINKLKNNGIVYVNLFKFSIDIEFNEELPNTSLVIEEYVYQQLINKRLRKKLLELKLTEKFQENYWNRIVNNSNSPIVKFLIFPSLKLLYFADRNYYHLINDYPFIKIKIQNVNNSRKKYKINFTCGIAFEKLPDIFISKNKFPTFRSIDIRDFSF